MMFLSAFQVWNFRSLNVEAENLDHEEKKKNKHFLLVRTDLGNITGWQVTLEWENSA